MSAIILRRRKLGRTSAREIANMSREGIQSIRNWRRRDLNKIEDKANLTVIRWGCTSSLQDLGLVAKVMVNTSDAIRWCSDKRQGRLDMQKAGVSVPVTFPTVQEWAKGRVKDKPYVLRPSYHAQGRHLLVASKLGEMAEFVEQHPEYYISELVDKVAEYRVLVCQARVVWVAKKTPGNPEEVAWNVARGGRFDNVRWSDWPIAVLHEAVGAAKVSGTDFCGVDVMVDKEGKAYVLEVNSAPSQTSPYRQECLSKAFDNIVANGKKHFKDIPFGPRRTWKSYIHPAVRGKDG